MSTCPKSYVVALFPGFQLLDLAGPLDILNTLSQRPQGQSISLSIVASTLDPVPTRLISPASNKWTFESADLQSDSFNQLLQPTHTFDQFLSASPALNVDVLFIPGGIGSRVKRLLPDGGTVSNVADLISFTQKVAPRISNAIMTVCTGSDILAHTGLLDGRRATTNMTRYDFVAGRNPQVQWLKARRWVRSTSSEIASITKDDNDKYFKGEIWTSAGVSAGIDLTLSFVAEHYGGMEFARSLSRHLEYEWREVSEGQVDAYYSGPGWGT